MNDIRTRHQPVSYKTEEFTTWFNPLQVAQHVDVFYGSGFANEPQATRFTVQPGQKLDIPSRFDYAIQKVSCDKDECKKKAPGFCSKGHSGTILGGLAPQLVREGSRAVLAEALDPSLAEKRQQEAKLAAANIARHNAENAMLLAEARRLELEAEIKVKAEAEKGAAEAERREADRKMQQGKR